MINDPESPSPQAHLPGGNIQAKVLPGYTHISSIHIDDSTIIGETNLQILNCYVIQKEN